MISVYLDWKLKRRLSYLKSPSIFLKREDSRKNEVFKSRTKDALFGYFWVGIWKSYSHNINQGPRICHIARLSPKKEIPTFGTKNTLVQYFFGWNLKIIFLYSSQCSRSYLISKFYERKKCLSLVGKMPYLGVFGLEI